MSVSRAALSASSVDPAALLGLEGLELKARLIVEGYLTGLHRSPYHGFSVEFAEHRAYQPGQNPRTIDWRVYGRTERLFVKRYEEETNLRAHLIVDVSDSMRYPALPGVASKLQYAVHLAAGLGYLMLRQRDAVGLTLFDSAVRAHVPTRAQGGWLRPVLQALEAQLAPADAARPRTTAAPEVLHSLIPQLGRRALVVVVSDFLPEAAEPEAGYAALLRALQHLRHARHEVLLLQVRHEATEGRLELPAVPHRLRDLEGGGELPVHPAQVRAAYVQAMRRHGAYLTRRCRELQIERLELDVHTPFDRALAGYLRQRALYVR